MEQIHNAIAAQEDIRAHGAANELFTNEIQRLKQLPPLNPGDPKSIKMAVDEFDEALEIWSEVVVANFKFREDAGGGIALGTNGGGEEGAGQGNW
ncbi:unnamed protein product [Cercospora beticola]|nr:unnamed protein product [Cercospora beticola]